MFGFQETATKKKEADRELLGVEAYEAQQLVTKQQSQLNECITELESISAAREEVENQLEETTALHKEQTSKLIETEKRGT